MRSLNNIKLLLAGALSIIFIGSGVAQEYDDMYFTGKDRKRIQAEKKAREDSLKRAEEELLSKNVNPDYMDRLGEYNEEAVEDAYFDENYADQLLSQGNGVTINNYYGYPSTTLDDIYWSNPGFYRYTVFDPFYRTRLRFYNSWYGGFRHSAYYDSWGYRPYWGGSNISFSYGWGYSPFINYYNSWSIYDPWGSWYDNSYYYYSCRPTWSGFNRPFYPTRVVVVENANVRRDRRSSRSSSYGRRYTSNGVVDGGRRANGGRVDNSGNSVRTRRTSGVVNDSRNTSGGRTDAVNNVNTRSRNITSSRSYNSYENRNLRSYSRGSTNGDLYSSRDVNNRRTSSINRTIRSNSIQSSTRSNYNRNSSTFDRSGNSFNSGLTRSRSVTNTSSSNLNRSGTSSYHSRSNGISRNSSSGTRSFNSYNSGNSSRSRSISSGSRSSGSSSGTISRSSGNSSSRSSGSSNRSSSSSSRTSSRRGGN